MFNMMQHNKELVNANAHKFNELNDACVLITGASGLIGAAMVRFLLERNRELKAAHTHIIAQIRSEEKARNVLGDYCKDENLTFLQADIATFNRTNISCDYIIHTAAPTASAFFAKKPVETCLSIVDGTYFMLELALAQKAGLVYLSSMEVYGAGNKTYGLENKLSEEQVGYVDPCALRSCYPESKRMAEQLTCAYATQHELDAKIVRLAQTFGAGIPQTDTRVFSQFAHAAVNGTDIVLKTDGNSSRMYCGIDDAITGILTVLLKGEKVCAYNLANEQTYCSIKEMAQLVVDNFGKGKTKLCIDIDENAPYPPEHHLPLDTQALQALGWQATQSLKDMFSQLIDYMVEHA